MTADLPKILITGPTGQVGFELCRSLAPLGSIAPLPRMKCDLADTDSIRAAIRDLRPDVIVNPAAYTAVDKAESDEANARGVNGVAPGVIGEEAARIGAFVVHYSTDYVYDGTKQDAYVETDATNPLGVYGRTKLEGEQALAATCPQHLIFRTSWVFGAYGSNFLKTILRLARERDELRIVADQFGAPTGAALIADITAQTLAPFLRQGNTADLPRGIIHLSASGRTSWHDYAKHIVEMAHRSGMELRASPERIHPIPASSYPTPAVRPANSSLGTTKLRETFGITPPDWRQGVDYVIDLLAAKRISAKPSAWGQTTGL